MTQLRKDADAISNYFDALTEGLGKRGSSFMDIDAVAHDKDSGRFLFIEFKQPDEPLHPAQLLVLRDLARLPRCTVWFLRRLAREVIGWTQYGADRQEELLSEREFQDRYRAWWHAQ